VTYYTKLSHSSKLAVPFILSFVRHFIFFIDLSSLHLLHRCPPLAAFTPFLKHKKKKAPTSIDLPVSQINEKLEVPAHGTTMIKVVYTNMAEVVRRYIERIDETLRTKKKYEKIVSLDVEFTDQDRKPQKAIVIQLCVGTDCLVYHHCHADEQCPKFLDFLGDHDITFAGCDITNDVEMLRRSMVAVGNLVDIQQRWKPAGSKNQKDSLADYAKAIIDSWYETMKQKLSYAEHKWWGDLTLTDMQIRYASLDAYMTYEVYRRLVIFEEGQKSTVTVLGGAEEEQEESLPRGLVNRKQVVRCVVLVLILVGMTVCALSCTW
jgi:hypothetical protein